jgi:uncharacterized protein (TIGR00251 family)
MIVQVTSTITTEKLQGVLFSMNSWYRYNNDNLIFNVYIQPGAKCTQVVGLHGEALKIKLASPPIDGRANKALLQFISTKLHIPLGQIKLLRGEKSRHKTIEVSDCSINPKSIFLD